MPVSSAAADGDKADMSKTWVQRGQGEVREREACVRRHVGDDLGQAPPRRRRRLRAADDPVDPVAVAVAIAVPVSG